MDLAVVLLCREGMTTHWLMRFEVSTPPTLPACLQARRRLRASRGRGQGAAVAAAVVVSEATVMLPQRPKLRALVRLMIG